MLWYFYRSATAITPALANRIEAAWIQILTTFSARNPRTTEWCTMPWTGGEERLLQPTQPARRNGVTDVDLSGRRL